MSPTMTRRALGALALAAGASAARAVGAQTAAGGRPILTVSGRIGPEGNGDPVRLDRAALEAIGTGAFETSTPWQDKPSRFEGVPAARLMAAVGARGSAVTALALDDYKAEIPLSDFERFDVLLALKRDGAYMTVRDKGPLWLVYPYDGRPELKSHLFYHRAVWQLSKLIVR